MSSGYDLHMPLAQAVACANSFGAPNQWLAPMELDLLSQRTAIKQKNGFIAARFLLKQLLTQHITDTSPLDWVILPQATGQPQVFYQGQASKWHTSISHSKTQVIVALSHHPIGVDIEDIKPRDDLPALLEQVCHDTEIQWWQTQPEPLTAFYQIWTAKEAWSKTTGMGLDMPVLRATPLTPSSYGNTWGNSDISISFIKTNPLFMCALATQLPLIKKKIDLS